MPYRIFACLWQKGKNAGNAAPVENQQFIKVSGIVRLVGNSPFTELVITGPDAEWFIAADDRAKLHDLQQRAVTVEGIETVTELRFGNGLPAGTRRELRNIRIINTNEE